jgi:hypothetical protein
VKQFWKLPALPGAHSCESMSNDRPECRWARKKPAVAVTPGLGSSVRFPGRSSTAQRWLMATQRGQKVRRLTGEATFGSWFVSRIYPPSRHGWFPHCNKTNS